MNKKSKILIKIYTVVAAVLLFLTISLNYFPTINNYNYSSVITYLNVFKIVGSLVFVIVAIFMKVANRYKYLYLVANVINIVADYFLSTFGGFNLEAGVIAFILVQLIYAVVLFDGFSETINKLLLIVRFVSIVIVEIIISILLKGEKNDLIYLVGFYGVNLIMNVILSFVKFNNNKVLAIALLFFFLCDVTIGLTKGVSFGILNISTTSLIYKYITIPFDFVWLFYSICQWLLPISVLIKRKRK